MASSGSSESDTASGSAPEPKKKGGLWGWLFGSKGTSATDTEASSADESQAVAAGVGMGRGTTFSAEGSEGTSSTDEEGSSSDSSSGSQSAGLASSTADLGFKRGAASTFGAGGVGDALPTLVKPRADMIGLRIADALREAGFASSISEGRRHIKGGGVLLNNTVVQDETAVLTEADFTDGQAKLSLGKKKHLVLSLS